ncbi:MAG TPA: MarR family transcriptional regulator [Thermoanaerobaculia bacterium]|nr:MarR family transcriptional regulator [Thermoanaerobaculia bacterium]
MAAKARGLQAELKQRKPFHSPAQELSVGLLRTADVLRHVLADQVRADGITLQQYNVLRILRGAGEEGLPTLEIAARMIERAPGVTRLLDRLEKKGLAERRRCSPDRRQILCFITTSGLRLLAKLDARVTSAEEAFAQTLGKTTVRQVNRALETLRRRPA